MFKHPMETFRKPQSAEQQRVNRSENANEIRRMILEHYIYRLQDLYDWGGLNFCNLPTVKGLLEFEESDVAYLAFLETSGGTSEPLIVLKSGEVVDYRGFKHGDLRGQI